MRIEKTLTREEVCEIVRLHLVRTDQIPEQIDALDVFDESGWVNGHSSPQRHAIRVTWEEPALR